MNNDSADEGGFEGVCSPIIRLEATLHPVSDSPSANGANGTKYGESEPCDWSALIKVEMQLKPVAGTINRFSVEEYHRLIERGILTTEDKVELLEGCLVERKHHHPPAACTLQHFGHAFHSALPPKWCYRIRSAITLSDSEPEPDIAVVRSDDRRYTAKHPHAEDIGLLIEVSDSTLLGDRADKGRIYARANVPVYWIVNLIDRQFEVYEQPSGATALPAYAKTTIYHAGDSVPLVLDGNTVATFAVQDLLP